MRAPLVAWLVLGLTACAGDPAPAPEGSMTEAASAEEPSAAAEHAGARLAAGDALFRQRKYDEALPVYQAAAEAAEAEGDRSIQVEALAQVARMHSLAQRLDEAGAWLARAEAAADPGLPLGWTRLLGVRGILQREGGDKAAALATFVGMHDYALAHDLPRRAVDAAHHAAIVAPPAEQVTWAERGIAAAEATGDEGWLAALWNNLGATHEERGDWAAAADAYARAKHYHDRTGGEPQKLAAAWALGRSCLRAGRLDEAARLLPDCLARARRWHERDGAGEAAEWLGFALAAHGELRVAQGSPREGLAQLERGRGLLVEAGIEQWWPAALADLEARIAAARHAGGEAAQD